MRIATILPIILPIIPSIINCIDSAGGFKLYFQMPVIFRYKGCRFFFFSNEENPREPLHIHVRKGENIAKFWMKPAVSVAESYGFSSGELTGLAKVIESKAELIERCWNEFFR